MVGSSGLEPAIASSCVMRRPKRCSRTAARCKASTMITRHDRIFASSGLRGVYDAWLEQLKPNKNVPRMMVASYAVRAGHSAEAIELLRESAQRREAGTLWLAVDPVFASLHHQREFAAIVASSFQTR